MYRPLASALCLLALTGPSLAQDATGLPTDVPLVAYTADDSAGSRALFVAWTPKGEAKPKRRPILAFDDWAGVTRLNDDLFFTFSTDRLAGSARDSAETTNWLFSLRQGKAVQLPDGGLRAQLVDGGKRVLLLLNPAPRKHRWSVVELNPASLTTKTLRTLDLPGIPVGAPLYSDELHVSPDGQTLAYAVPSAFGSLPSVIQGVDLKTGAVRRLGEARAVLSGLSSFTWARPPLTWLSDGRLLAAHVPGEHGRIGLGSCDHVLRAFSADGSASDLFTSPLNLTLRGGELHVLPSGAVRHSGGHDLDLAAKTADPVPHHHPLTVGETAGPDGPLQQLRLGERVVYEGADPIRDVRAFGDHVAFTVGAYHRRVTLWVVGPGYAEPVVMVRGRSVALRGWVGRRR